MHRSYQPLKPVTNRYLQQRWDQSNYENHRRKVGGWRVEDWFWCQSGGLDMKSDTLVLSMLVCMFLLSKMFSTMFKPVKSVILFR